MNKLIRKIIIWAFKDRITVLGMAKTLTDSDLVMSNYPVNDYIKNDYIKEEIALRIAHKMKETGIMMFSQERDTKHMTHTIIGKIYVLKL